MEDLKLATNRLKSVLNKDKGLKTDNLVNVVKSDVCELLSNYFVFDDCFVQTQIEQTQDGFVFSCTAKCDKVKTLNYLR